MFKRLFTTVSVAAIAAMASTSWAQMTPVGQWQSIDDATDKPRSLIRITDKGGVLFGVIERGLEPGADPARVCVKCSDDRKDKRMLGLEIIRGAKKADGKDVWQGGKILDPDNGSEYTLRLTPIEGGKKLEVHGSIGPFGRTQTWLRTQ